MVWRLLYATVFLGLVLLVGVSLPVSPAEATNYQCGNITVPWPLGIIGSGPDRDCDGFSDSREDYLGAPENSGDPEQGTHRYVGCAASSATSDERHMGIFDAMPTDFNDNQVMNGQDSAKFSVPYNHWVSEGPFYVWPNEGPVPGERFDFSGDGVINGQDTGKYQTYGNHSCVITPTPPSATTSRYMETVDPGTLYNEGCAQSRNYESGVIVLDFGQPDYYNNQYGTRLHDNPATHVTTTQIRTAAENFASGFWNCTPPSVPAIYLNLAVGTDNFFDATGYAHGAHWATLVNDVNDFIDIAGFSPRDKRLRFDRYGDRILRWFDFDVLGLRVRKHCTFPILRCWRRRRMSDGLRRQSDLQWKQLGRGHGVESRLARHVGLADSGDLQ